MPSFILFLLIVIFLLLSSFFSSSETALFSIPRERLSFYQQSNKKSYQWVYKLLRDGQRTLLCILLGNLVVNVTVVGFVYKLMLFFVSKNTTLASLFVATGIILLFGEILPKSIAIRNSEAIARFNAPILYHLKLALHPILLLLQKLNIFFLARFSRHLRKPSPYITLDEFKSSIAESTQRGALSESEWQIVQRVLDAADMPVLKVMTHRSQLQFVSATDTLSEAILKMCKEGQTFCCIKSRACSDEIDGLVYLSDALKCNGDMNVDSIMKPVIWVADSSEIADLIGVMFRKEYTEVCIHNEFGSFVGVFSLNEGLNTVLKLTSSELTSVDQGVVSKEFNGMVELETIKDWIPPSLSNQAKSSRTLNGLISTYLGRIPKTGERFAIDGWNFYIIKSKLNSIESVLIRKEG